LLKNVCSKLGPFVKALFCIDKFVNATGSLIDYYDFSFLIFNTALEFYIDPSPMKSLSSSRPGRLILLSSSPPGLIAPLARVGSSSVDEGLFGENYVPIIF